ncbi:MAG: 30S ribosomal protein S12 [Candidatus Aenigmarchaeota archaeon]|nr:30S ribosomal protein S12 [Candidatus Aenigmarchaeota archaeon]
MSGGGAFSARNLKKKRAKARWHSRSAKKRLLKLWKLKPLRGAPIAKAIVLKKKGIEQKQPHSGIIKAVRVQLIKNSIQVTAVVPGTGAIKHIDEHDEVTLAGLGASQGGAVGSMHGVKHKVIAVKGVSLSELLKGKKEKPKQ